MAVIEVNSDNFQEVVIDAKKPVLVDFWASWCNPCRMQTPVIEELADEVGDKAIVAKINVDEQLELARIFSVRSIPTLAVFKDGKVVNRRSGFTPKAELLAMLK